MNTIKRHKEQINNALHFLGKAKFTSAQNLQLVVGRRRRGFPTQLKSLGLVLSRETTGGQHIFGLSKKGADLIGTAQIDIHKVGLSRIEHALIAQYETLSSIEDFQIDDYEFESQKLSKDARPDACWHTPLGRYNIEIELSAKSLSDGEMDRFFQKIISGRTIVVFREATLLERYLRHAQQYAQNGIADWEKVDGKWFKPGGIIRVEKADWDHVYFRQHNHAGIMSINEYFDETM
jgi:hypothetical protein